MKTKDKKNKFIELSVQGNDLTINLSFLKNFFIRGFNEKPLNIKRANLFYQDTDKKTISFVNLKKINMIYNNKTKQHNLISEGNIFNLPLPAGTNSNEYFDAYEHVLKKLNEFKPEFIFFSAGFDAHKDDPLSNINLNSQDYFEITKRTLITSKDYCKGNIVSILEGGYDLNALAESTEEHIKALIEF